MALTESIIELVIFAPAFLLSLVVLTNHYVTINGALLRFSHYQMLTKIQFAITQLYEFNLSQQEFSQVLPVGVAIASGVSKCQMPNCRLVSIRGKIYTLKVIK